MQNDYKTTIKRLSTMTENDYRLSATMANDYDRGLSDYRRLDIVRSEPLHQQNDVPVVRCPELPDLLPESAGVGCPVRSPVIRSRCAGNV